MQKLHLALGIFDGVHLGHQKLIQQACCHNDPSETAQVLTFHPHPQRVLGFDHPKLIYDLAQRKRLLQNLGVSHIYIKKFSTAWSQFQPDQFFKFLKRAFPNLHTLHVGEDFHFGYQKQGNIQTLDEFCQKDEKVHLKVCSHLQYQQTRISSSRIRQALLSGDIQLANALLGTPYNMKVSIHAPLNNTSKIKFDFPYELIPKNQFYAACIIYKTQRIPVSVQLSQDKVKITLPSKIDFTPPFFTLEWSS